MKRRDFLLSAVITTSGFFACRPSSFDYPYKTISDFPATGLFRISPNPAKGFYWPYYLFIPSNIAKISRLIVLGPNNIISTKLTKLEKELRTWFHWLKPDISEPLGMPILIPAFIRPPIEGLAGNLYTHALSQAALATKTPELRRVDLQTLSMVDDANERLKITPNALVDNRFFTIGYSAGADFAQRMAILHPERILASAVGGIGGMPTLPISTLDGKALTYPIGVSDLMKLIGQPFSTTAFKQTPLLLIQGSDDSNDSVGSLDSYSANQSHFIKTVFGQKPIDRIKRVSEIFRNFGMSQFDFRIHEGDGHHITTRFRREVTEWLISANAGSQEK